MQTVYTEEMKIKSNKYHIYIAQPKTHSEYAHDFIMFLTNVYCIPLDSTHKQANWILNPDN